jgi:hypothetical protein
VDEDVAADDGCAMVDLAATVCVVLLSDVTASFLDLRPDEDGASASSYELDDLASVDFASSFVDDLREDSVLAVPPVGVPALPSSSPFEAPDVEDVDDDFESEEDFDSAEEDLEESD